MYRVGLITICTGKYNEFISEFIRTFKENFCPESSVLYLFTDSDMKDQDRVRVIKTPHMGWPKMPLLRSEMLYACKELYSCEYLYVIDSDVYFKKLVTFEEIKGELVGTLHRNLKRKRKDFNYESRPESSAFIPEYKGTQYFAGGLYGGKKEFVTNLLCILRNKIRYDIEKGIRAIWGDESHINNIFVSNPPDKVLTPEYMCPKNNNNFDGKIIHCHKTFKKVNIDKVKNHLTVDPKEFENMVFEYKEENGIREVQFKDFREVEMKEEKKTPVVEEKKKILITGSKGYIGTKLLGQLNRTGKYTIYGIDRKCGMEILNMEEDQFPEVDCIIHLAAQSGAIPSMKDPEFDAENNIMVTLKLLRLYKNSKFIFTTSGAATDPKSPYGQSKQAAEGYIRILHDNYVILRLSSIYGGKDRGVVDDFLRSDSEITIFGDGSQVRDFVHVNDIVNALEKAIEWKCGDYICGSGKGTSIQKIAKASGKKIKYEDWREGELKKVVLKNTTPDWKPEIDVIDFVKENQS